MEDQNPYRPVSKVSTETDRPKVQFQLTRRPRPLRNYLFAVWATLILLVSIFGSVEPVAIANFLLGIGAFGFWMTRTRRGK